MQSPTRGPRAEVSITRQLPTVDRFAARELRWLIGSVRTAYVTPQPAGISKCEAEDLALEWAEPLRPPERWIQGLR
jgi:hypothetical protein